MGSSQSVRATHFQRPKGEAAVYPDPSDAQDLPDDNDHHISISNKMVERLVEDATLAGGAAAAVAKAAAAVGRAPKPDHRDNVFAEKLRRMDEMHSEKYGLTIEDMNALAKRVEMRTEVTLNPEPVCSSQSDRVVACYNACSDARDTARCWEAVGAFTACVQAATAGRLRARTEKEARCRARRSRHVAHAREHALKDLGAPTDTRA